MIDKLLIERKLRSIERYIAELERESFRDLESFRKDIIRKRFVERNLELAVEKMIDVCKHIISGMDLREPETYADCFRILGDAGVVPTADIETFKKMARFRNLLIHGYETVEDEITYEVLITRLDDFRLFCKTIREYMAARSGM